MRLTNTNFRRIVKSLPTVLLLAYALDSIAQESNPDSQFDAIIAEHWEYRMQGFPLEATQTHMQPGLSPWRWLAAAT